MVRTDADIENLSPEEQKKALEKAKQEKEKELERLLKEKEEEIKLAEEQIVHHEKIRQQEEDEQTRAEEERTKKKKEQEALEEVLANESQENEQKETGEQGQAVLYQQSLEHIPMPVYEFTNYNVYQELLGIERNIAQRGYANNDEQQRIKQFQDQHSTIRNAYSTNQLRTMDDSRNNYLQRTEGVLARIDKELHDLNSKMGDDFGHVYKQ